jgi:hypothetical protein
MNPNTIDVFYTPDFCAAALAMRVDRGRSYPAFMSGGAVRYRNNIVMSRLRAVFTLPHEIMHILLNAGHRADPPTALFRGGTTIDKRVDGTKRIGPYPDATAAGVGTTDTTTIRDHAESLP